MSNRLRARSFQISYGPADDRLKDFYVPALSCSVRYDRSAGFFSSSALAVAAAGVARLIANGGTMRLLVGADLSEDDVRAIEKGAAMDEVVANRLLRNLADPTEELMHQRLEVLAWMVAVGSLQIRVVLPKGPDGRPLPASQSRDYFHAKSGLFTDGHGDQIAFTGSVNESATGWQRNYEQFSVYFSWDATAPYLAQVQLLFQRLWEGSEPDWIALGVPQAVRERLLTFRPAQKPRRDPLEPDEPEIGDGIGAYITTDTQQRERVLFQFLCDAPFLPNAQWLGAATSVVTPWPHQARIADSIVGTFPERYLLCDEVGLGKTIEAGLAIRQLILSGVVRRGLILAPKSVCRQWQEELYEKFALNVPCFDGRTFHDIFGQERIPDSANPWDGAEVYIASSQLAKRRERQEEVLAAGPWDLVVIDEAHHARRKDFLQPTYRPNRLLELLMGREGRPGLKDRTAALLLLTATPMQVHPVEVWDLLRVLGVGGRWGASDGNFLRFFGELRKPFEEIDWSFVLGMVHDHLHNGGAIAPTVAAAARKTLGLVQWEQLRIQLQSDNPAYAPGRLRSDERACVLEVVRRHTPLQRFLFRSTRRLLREYVSRGILQARVPQRRPEAVWIDMRREEQELYDRIEEYISGFYRKYEEERKGLGFVMTVYRRRLTSSFYAVRRSLERRLAFLQGRTVAGALAGFDEDDLEQADLSLDVVELLDEDERAVYQDEVTYVEDFLHELQMLPGNDSKAERLIADLDEIFRQRETVLVFTQYTDTMDFLREQLRQVYGGLVACYSGRGGEKWNGIAWVTTTKEEIKNAFLKGDTVKLLLCTEAASEGLNLQTCGVLINYDVPWNPMRVEQRIGRVDRIGQVHDEVQIRHYFYEGTVEARVYRALEKRIDWFESVVGRLQPILAQVGQAIQAAAMTPAEQRQRVLQEEIQRLNEELDRMETEALDLDQFLAPEEPLAQAGSPVTLSDLERIITSSSTLAQCFQPHSEFPGAYWLEFGETNAAVTFDAELFDRYPNTLQLLTYGSDLFRTLLEAVPPPATASAGSMLRCTSEGPLSLRAYYELDGHGQLQPITNLVQLETHLTAGSSNQWSEETQAAALADFRQELATREQRYAQVMARRQRSERLALEEQARQTLLQAALVELAMGQQPQLFGDEPLPMAFTPEAITGLQRHHYPFAPLLTLVDVHGLRPSPTDPYYLQMQGQSQRVLQGHFTALEQKAGELVQRLAASQHQQDPSDTAAATQARSELL